MKVGLMLPLFSGDGARVIEFARDAEARGFDGVFAFDHFFPPGRPERPSLEAFASLAAVAAATGRIAIGTLVARAGVRPPGLLAKMAAQIDDIGDGRMILGIGAGDSRDEEESRVFGLGPPRSRDDRLLAVEECARSVKALFGGAEWPGGKVVPRLAGPLLPPVRSPQGPPVWIGADSEEGVLLAARFADGWNSWGTPEEEFRAKLELLEREAAGREVTASWAGVALVGETEAEAKKLREERGSKGFLDDGLWNGGAGRFADFATQMGASGAEWLILVAAGPRDRTELIAETLLRGGGMMAEGTLAERKAVMRVRMRAERDSLSESSRDELGALIAERAFAELSGRSRPMTVMMFLSFGSEIPTDGLAEKLHSAGIRIAVPRLAEEGIVPVDYVPGEPVTQGKFGIREPQTLREIDPWSLDAVIAPGLGFDRRGARLGYGGGYFDALLRKMKPGALRIGIGFHRQLVDEVPAGHRDEMLDLVVTDKETIECGPQAAAG